jgi:hypothetical protein
MCPFSKPTIEDVQSKAFLVFHEFGSKAQIPREQRLLEEFPGVDRDTIKAWLSDFQVINDEMAEFVGNSLDIDYDRLKVHLKKRFPFLNRKALDRAAFLAWFGNR